MFFVVGGRNVEHSQGRKRIFGDIEAGFSRETFPVKENSSFQKFSRFPQMKYFARPFRHFREPASVWAYYF
ncbi:hypothetical protein CH375_13450 [Leptospira ellisii]|uniref:Uncharacterized protein n=1 Tax=Leptospira ellisii TaxID=2023197 RepID=A0A2N0B3L9_9LEPT|nr:hypothetical protein CH379_20270 [Leptospira ellisii]PKA04028.1 hypothetical protein CH375_13450 [Leptospira ellisii]